MLTPDFKTFSQLALDASLVPVFTTVPADLLTPVSAFLSIAQKEPHAFLLESVEGGEKIGRYTFLGVRPYMIVQSRGEKIEIKCGKKTSNQKGKIFEVVGELLKAHKSAVVPGLPPFTSGAVGFFSYDAVRQLEKIGNSAKDDLDLPDCSLMFFDRVLAFDHVRHEIYIIATADVHAESPEKAYKRAQQDIAQLEKQLRAGAKSSARKVRPNAPPKIKHRTEQKKFLNDVARLKEYISAGDVFQTVLSLRLELEPGVPAFDIYRELRRVNPSPYLYYLRMNKLEILGSSPEMLVKARRTAEGATMLRYRPIAGTRKRGADETTDRALEGELRADEKERAEHVMLVDLGRNDLGRVSAYGSVKVNDFMFVERYSHVMHLVTTLEGKLRSGLAPIDAFAACFPAGTLTGAPKVRAMQIIEELEPVRRGIYGGAVLYADFAGNLDSCIAIRTMVIEGKRAYVQAGAGIVADSVPESEHQECLNKAAALIKAVEAARK